MKPDTLDDLQAQILAQEVILTRICALILPTLGSPDEFKMEHKVYDHFIDRITFMGGDLRKNESILETMRTHVHRIIETSIQNAQANK